MKKDTRLFFLASIFCAVFCIGIFVWGSLTMIRQGEQASMTLGEIYMKAMNFQMQLHFRSIIELKIKQVEGIVNKTPPEKNWDQHEKARQELRSSALLREFTHLALYATDGTAEVIFGEPVAVMDEAAFLQALNRGEKNVASGVTPSGRELVILGVSVGFPVSEGYPMKDGKTCTALVVGLPLENISDAMSLNLDKSMVYSHIIRKDGSFVFRNAAVKADNYYTWFAQDGHFEGKTAEEMVADLKDSIQKGAEHTMFMTVDGERHHVHCSPLPNSSWYLVTDMPYGELDKVVEGMWNERFITAVSAALLLPLPILALFFFYSRISRRQIAELEKARADADRASRAKSEFLSNMSHDIRTPMNAIVGMTAIASANAENSVLVQDCLRKITLSSRHLLGLINDVLDMSKIESGKLSLNMDVVSLREVLEGIVGIVQPQIKAKKQQFDIHIHNILSENVYSDSVRLSQVLLNLLSNALKFTPQGGSIQITLYQEESPQGEWFVRTHILVKDTGIGMTPEFQKRIFESFAREDNARVHKIEGTGLGMSIMKYIVDQMKGTIEIHSEVDKGTEFHITLDMKRINTQGEQMRLPDWNVLIVDDDAELCRTAAGALTEMGTTVDWALGGRQALAMAEERHREGRDYHVILLDWKMPEMDGPATARKLRELLGDQVPVLLVSSYDWSEIEQEARRAGISGFIPKPLFKSTLFQGMKPFMDADTGQVGSVDTGMADLVGRRILLSEDNELNWEVASAILEEFGFILDWAENGQICVDMFGRSEPGYYDLILMDVRMPVMNGYEATRAIRAMNRTDADIPIIAMTADAFSEDIHQCLESGMNAHVAKPLDIKVLMRLIQKYIR